MEHPPEDVLLRFTLGTSSRQENRQIVTHLLARCPSCAATLWTLRKEPPPEPPLDPGAYDAALDRLLARARELTSPPQPTPRPRLLSLRRNRTAAPSAEEGAHPPASAASDNGIPRRGSG